MIMILKDDTHIKYINIILKPIKNVANSFMVTERLCIWKRCCTVISTRQDAPSNSWSLNWFTYSAYNF